MSTGPAGKVFMHAEQLGKKGELFSYAILPTGKRRWRSFGAGFGIEIGVLVFIIWILPLIIPKQMADARQYLMTQITAPETDFWRPKPVPKPVVRPRPKPVEVAKVEPVEPPKPKIIEPVFERPVAPKPVAKMLVQTPELKEFAKAMPVPNPLTNPETELKKPKAPVQTGGFGDPNGLPKPEKQTQTVNMNPAGSFDMPTGPGKGNGTGGAKGMVGTTGFEAEKVTNGTRRGGAVEAGGFADERTATGTAHVQKAADATPRFQGIVVLTRPEGVYTPEAKRLKIQGNVVLQVIFKASGTVEVLRVVSGLGYGLDENAEAAARAVQFKPAMQDGQPIDLPGTIRVKFELAY